MLQAQDYDQIACFVATRFGLIIEAMELKRRISPKRASVLRAKTRSWSESSWTTWLRNRIAECKVIGETVPERKPISERRDNGSFLISGTGEKVMSEGHRLGMGFGLLAMAGDMNCTTYEFPSQNEKRCERQRDY